MPIDASQADPVRVNSAATTNALLIRAGKCSVGSLMLSNTGAAVAFVKLYDKATAPAVGTDVPVLTVPIAANGMLVVSGAFLGVPFELGLALSITNLGPDADTTAVAAGQVKVMGAIISM